MSKEDFQTRLRPLQGGQLNNVPHTDRIVGDINYGNVFSSYPHISFPPDTHDIDTVDIQQVTTQLENHSPFLDPLDRELDPPESSEAVSGAAHSARIFKMDEQSATDGILQPVSMSDVQLGYIEDLSTNHDRAYYDLHSTSHRSSNTPILSSSQDNSTSIMLPTDSHYHTTNDSHFLDLDSSNFRPNSQHDLRSLVVPPLSIPNHEALPVADSAANRQQFDPEKFQQNPVRSASVQDSSQNENSTIFSANLGRYSQNITPLVVTPINTTYPEFTTFNLPYDHFCYYTPISMFSQGNSNSLYSL